ncbi:MAG: SDR family NAD(P)-dependent oxidoreductase [Gammaproteobacteria bacterium]|nr:SDR family NAD(P)-dependent oxidoreductase [Gammaproteobacteria bacterium]
MKRRCFVISGTSRGIGYAIADALLASGHFVYGISRSEPEGLSDHDNFRWLQVDLGDGAASEAAMRRLLSSDTTIDGLINNAGSGLFGSLEEFSFSQIEQSLRINLLASIQLTRLLISTLKRQARSDIVFIGSESALQGGRYGSLYSAAKFGLRGFAQALRHECSNSNTHVSIVNPGMVRSSFFDGLHFEPGEHADNALLPRDVADAVMTIINAPDHALIDEINMTPLKRVARKKGR